MPRVIDMHGDPRQAHFEHFCAMRVPYVSVTANCDITALRRSDKPFFLTLLHCAVNAANGVPELRRRLRGQTVVEYESCLSSHTVLLPNGTYTYCALDCAMPLDEFLPYAQTEVERAKQDPLLDDGADAERLFFVSSLPWLRFTALTLPVSEPPDSNPCITFGKYFSEGTRVLLPVDLRVHHALADGLHIARFFEGLEARAAEIK